MVRCLICVLLLCSASVAHADPVLLLLLRMIRDQAVTTSLETGYGAMRQDPAPLPSGGYALPTPPVPHGSEEQHVRTLIDESFPYLSGAQRDVVFASMQKLLNDPRHAQIRPQIVAEFTLKARSMHAGYLSLDRLSYADKKALASRAKEEFRRMPAEDRQRMLEVLQGGSLPVPRDLIELMLGEFSAAFPVASNSHQSD